HQQAVDLPAAHGEGHLVQGPDLAEVAGDAAHLDAEALVGPRLGRRHRRAHGTRRTRAAIPGFSSGAGSMATFTPKTCSLRWSTVWMLRGVYSARSRISTTRPGNSRRGNVSTVMAAGWPTRTRPRLGS